MPVSSTTPNSTPVRPVPPQHSLSTGSVSKARRLFRGVSGYLNTGSSSGNSPLSTSPLSTSSMPSTLSSSIPSSSIRFSSSPDLLATNQTSRSRSLSASGLVNGSSTASSSNMGIRGNNDKDNLMTTVVSSTSMPSSSIPSSASSINPTAAIASKCLVNPALDPGSTSPTTPKNHSLIDLAFSGSSNSHNIPTPRLNIGSLADTPNESDSSTPDVTALRITDTSTTNIIPNETTEPANNNEGSVARDSLENTPDVDIAAVSSADVTATATPTATEPEEEFSIRLTPFLDHSSTAPALYFEPVVRRAPNGVVIKVGRYSDKDEDGQRPKDQASIVFRSKVVSRAHAELLITNNKWYIRDVKSSSGTFLNHVRLSPANMASASFAIRDGDVLQLGMDFRGGEEQYYKSVKVRIEINRSWQRRANKFNVSAMSKLKDLTGVGFPTNKSNDNCTVPLSAATDSASTAQECSICLVPIAPCQALFIAPCSHVWHYKCCRLLIIKAYPQFECPNCRAICDLEEDIEDSWNSVS